ncbi:MAG TPA: GNAT family N-acetyltransferase [Terriglobales bacterium]|nr:GNAT family N-acetyltransferase [Terriglobales bacterium]
MRLVLHREIPDDDLLARQWNELVQQMECPEVFYTYEWALAVSRAYRASITPLLMLAYEQDSLVGVAALATDPSQKETTFIAGTTADYCDFISHPELRSEFVELVCGELRNLKIPLVVLANLPADSATPRALPFATHAQEYSLFSCPAFRCAQVVLSSPEQKESTKQCVQRKQMLRRHLKAMSKIAPVELRHLRSREDIAAALPRFEQAHIGRFLSTGRVSNLVRAERRAFLAELAKLLSGPGWITLTSLNVGDEPVAWNYGFQFAGSWFWYMPTFDNGFERYYPGLCLLAKIVEEACERPEINRVDLGLGAEGYKERFATGARQTLDVTITASTARHLKEIVRYHAASAIKSSPPLEHCIRRLLGRTSAGGA